MDELTYLIEGYKVTFRWESSDVEPIVRDLELPNFVIHDGPGDVVFLLEESRSGFRIKLDEEDKGRSPLDRLHYHLSRKLQLEVATHAPDLVFVHAGVVRYRDALIVIPGKSFSGKSTLVRELCKAGATYYSDEYAIVEKSGLVRPWPRPISIRTDGVARDTMKAVELGWEPSHGAAHVNLVILTRFEEDAVWKPEEVTPGAAVLELIANTVSARVDPKRAIEHLTTMAVESRNFKSPRGDAAETATQILELAAAARPL